MAESVEGPQTPWNDQNWEQRRRVPLLWFVCHTCARSRCVDLGARLTRRFNPPTGIWIALVGFFLTGVALGLSSIGIECNTSQLPLEPCITLIAGFWSGAGLIGFGGFLTAYWRVTHYRLNGRQQLASGRLASLPPSDDLAFVARDLCKQLGYPQLRPDSVSWEKYSPVRGEGMMPSDHCVVLRDRVVLPESMRGRLGSKEWRPLLACSLVYYNSKAIRRRNMVGLGWSLSAILGWGLFFVVLFRIYGPTTPLPRVLVLSLILVLTALTPFGVYSYLRFERGTSFLADNLACQSLGETRGLLETLKSIDSMRLEDIERIKKSRSPMLRYGRPKITERIASTSSFSP